MNILEVVEEITGGAVLCAPMKVDRNRLLAVWLKSSGSFSVTFSCKCAGYCLLQEDVHAWTLRVPPLPRCRAPNLGAGPLTTGLVPVSPPCSSSSLILVSVMLLLLLSASSTVSFIFSFSTEVSSLNSCSASTPVVVVVVVVMVVVLLVIVVVVVVVVVRGVVVVSNPTFSEPCTGPPLCAGIFLLISASLSCVSTATWRLLPSSVSVSFLGTLK